MRKWADWLDKQSDGSGDAQPPLLKPGDASMASPFTVKATDVLPTTDIIKQGRCTLVVTIQMFKILGLLSLCSAYSLSVLYLAGVKLGDIQVLAFNSGHDAMVFDFFRAVMYTTLQF